MKTVYCIGFGKVILVKGLRNIPKGDFGSANYECTVDEEYPNSGLNIYSSMNCGEPVFYGFY